MLQPPGARLDQKNENISVLHFVNIDDQTKINDKFVLADVLSSVMRDGGGGDGGRYYLDRVHGTVYSL